MINKQELRFGVNYVPSKNWWYSWVDWDRNSISEDLHAIASLGMDHIRIHCLWSVFQPNPAYASEYAIDRLAELLEIADKCSLDVEVTVLDGWLSGFAFYPSWRGIRNIFTDADVIRAEKLLYRAIADKVGKHPRFLGFDLGNEINVLQHFGNHLTIAEGDAWLKDIMAFCEDIAPDKFHVNGVDHNPWFMDSAFSRECLASTGAVTSLHTWIEFTGALSKYSPMEVGCIHLAEYCIEQAKAFSNDSRRLIWVQEFGATPFWMSEDRIPDFAEQTIRNAASCENVWGFTWWCSHDIDKRFKEFHELEYGLGLIDINNNIKPVGKRIANLVKEFRQNPPLVVERPVALVFPDDLFEKLQKERSFNYPDNPGWVFAKPYMDMVKEGIHPAVVLESRTGDKKYLESRGIKELIIL